MDKDILRKDRAALAREIEQAGSTFKGNACKCPFHEDRSPSAGVYVDDMGIWRFRCQAASCGVSGDIFDIQARLRNTTAAEVLKAGRADPARRTPAPKLYADIEALKAAMLGTVEATYQYTDPRTGKADMLVIRCKTADGKTFRQCRPHGTGYVMQAPAKPWPLYNRARIQQADTVVVVEGEKCVHALHEFGITATTSPAGAGKASHADWTPLAGKNVILWADNDTPGISHMQQVRAILESLEPSPRIAVIEPADLDLQEKEDAVDFIAQLGTLHTDKAVRQSAIMEALSKAKVKGVAAGVGELIENTISGKRQAIQWPWACVGGLTKALLPGTVTLLCGNVGASKSFMLLEAGMFWHGAGIKTAIYELEEDRDFHLLRCLAQRSRTGDITDPDWIRDNAEQARTIFDEHKVFLDGFGSQIFASPDTQPTLEQVAAWVKDRAKAGCRIIAIDPITIAAHKGRSSWEEDAAFLHNIKHTTVDHHCSIVLITHPVKAMSFPDVTQLAGGAAYQRFAQTIVWLESHADKTSTVKTPCGPADVEHNRILHILKARNGRGQGVKLACGFESESLTLRELGIIVKKKKSE